MKDKKKKYMSRRTFVKASASAGLAGSLGFMPVIHAAPRNPEKLKYAIVGLGSRSRMYQGALQGEYSKYGELVGFCDPNAGRLQVAQNWATKDTGKKIPLYSHEDFDTMVQDQKPDRIIVTTVDGFHHKYIVRGMELGCDVITEKPMTIDGEKCQKIIDTQKRSGKHCRVTFNYRYSPPRTQVKDLLMSGEIGEVLSVDFHWMLNTHHGADYFRRWHSQKSLSGGLMVHKATHHFDLVNWWLSAVPVSVYATGKREFYTPAMAKRFGLDSHHERCFTCPEKAKCGFELDLTKSSKLKRLYLDNEKYDGYFRDRCVFRPGIDIEDTMNVIVRYDNNISLCYSLNAFNSWEGYYVVFNGTRGRLEHRIQEKIYVSGTETEQGGIKRGGTSTRIIPLRAPAREIGTWTGEGGHGGGDKLLLTDIFAPDPPKDKYLRAADQRSGALSILIGAAANISIKNGLAVNISDMVGGLQRPGYPTMPGRSGPLPMPPKKEED